jgi:CubicO group peptidase (beta-lactamase class C family)
VPTLLQVLNGEPPANTPPVRANLLPGSQFRYSGAHYSVLQQLMIDVSGEAFPELMHALLFAPLGMHNSSYDQEYPEHRIETTAVGHYIGGEPVHGKWRVLPEMAGAGLWTTPTDLALLACEINRAYAGRGLLLRQDLVHEALTPQIAPDFGLGCDLGNLSGNVRFGHGGDNIGYKCQTRAFVGDGPGVVVTTNGDDGWQIVQEVMQTVADVYAWPEAGSASTVVQAKDLVGSYELRPGLVVQLGVEGDELQLVLPAQPPIRFVASDHGTWTSSALSSRLSFEQDDSGAVTSLKIRQEGSSLAAKRIA